jgi:DNA polymerase elongation subunit (family B)/predicted RNA-binding Zn-ribbon protein involved in translation (DUF1610 family)
MAKGPNVLLYDIETSLELVSVFDLQHNDYIDPSSIVLERHLVSVAWKLLDAPKVHAVSLLDNQKLFERDPHNDKHVLEVFSKVLMEADVVVGHNSDAFDMKFIETRMLHHNMDPLPPITSLDTYKAAKARFRFNSNKLTYLGSFLGVGKKMETSHGLWMKVLNGDKKAIKEMVEYNKEDVRLLERVFKKLQPYMANHINRELYGEVGCPRCGSNHIQSRGVHRAISNTYQRFQCQECHGWFREVKAKTKRTNHRVL